MTTSPLTLDLLRLVRDDKASEEQRVQLWNKACSTCKAQVRNQSHRSTDPCQSNDDQTQEIWLNLKGWCQSFPDDDDMPPEQWFRVCFRNMAINRYKNLARRRPRDWQSYEKLSEQFPDSNPFEPTGDPSELGVHEVYSDLIITLDHDLPLCVEVDGFVGRKVFKKFLGLRLYGFSVHEAAQLLRMSCHSWDERLRLLELRLFQIYLGYKPRRNQPHEDGA